MKGIAFALEKARQEDRVVFRNGMISQESTEKK
jgi:hypothetical protein